MFILFLIVRGWYFGWVGCRGVVVGFLVNGCGRGSWDFVYFWVLFFCEGFVCWVLGGVDLILYVWFGFWVLGFRKVWCYVFGWSFGMFVMCFFLVVVVDVVILGIGVGVGLLLVCKILWSLLGLVVGWSFFRIRIFFVFCEFLFIVVFICVWFFWVYFWEVVEWGGFFFGGVDLRKFVMYCILGFVVIWINFILFVCVVLFLNVLINFYKDNIFIWCKF